MPLQKPPCERTLAERAVYDLRHHRHECVVLKPGHLVAQLHGNTESASVTEKMQQPYISES